MSYPTNTERCEVSAAADFTLASSAKDSGRDSCSSLIWKSLLPLLVMMFMLISGQQVRGQVVTGTLTGTVVDLTGATVPEAKVTITEISTGVQRSTTTSADGLYDFPYLAPGDYKVDVTATGFKSFSQSDITVSVSTTARLSAVLTPGSASETVLVTGRTAAANGKRRGSGQPGRAPGHRRTAPSPQRSGSRRPRRRRKSTSTELHPGRRSAADDLLQREWPG